MKILLCLSTICLLAGCYTSPVLTSDRNPCQDSAYLALKAQPYDKLTPAQQSYYLQKDLQCSNYDTQVILK